MSRKMKKFLRDTKARMLPYSVIFLLIIAGLTSMFFVLPGNKFVRALSEHSDDFEDDTPGQWPDEDWYILSIDNINVGDRNVTDSTSYDGSNCLLVNYSDPDNNGHMFFNTTSENEKWSNFSFWFYAEADNNDFSTWYSNGTNGSAGSFASVRIGCTGIGGGDAESISIKGGGGEEITDIDYTFEEWWFFKVSFNWTDETFSVHIHNDTQENNTEWFTFIYSVSEGGANPFLGRYHFTNPKGKVTNIYLDNMQFNGTTSGAAQGEICYYNYTGLDESNRTTFGSGTPGDTLYSNATANWNTGAMLTIEISVNDTVYVEDVCIDFAETDLHTSVHWENISISVDLDNSTWHAFAAVTDIDQGGDASNISLNTSWASICSDGNPFPISNTSVGVDDYIYVLFKLDLPDDAETGGPYTTDSWNILWKTVES